MRGRTLIRIGAGWLGILILALLAFVIALKFEADVSFGIGLDLPFGLDTFAGKFAYRLLFVAIYVVLLGWLPFLLIGALRVLRERAAKPEIGIEVR